MNLTKCFAASLCLSAMTASAGFLVATNDFEGGTLEGTWSGGVNALDDIVAGSTGVTDADSPLVGVTDNKLLKLDTEGGIWTNTVSQSFETTPIYCDMLVKFVPSEELPALTDGKLAIAIKLGLDGTNYLNIANNNGSTFAWAATAKAISTSAWYRVTVKMYWDGLAEATFAQTYVNGTAVGSPLVLDGNTTLNSIGFQGTGYVDEIVVRNDSPFVVQFAGTGAVITNPTVYDAWLLANSLTRETVNINQYNAYLFGVAPDGATSPLLKVSSITVGGNIVLTLAADYATAPDVAINPANLNNGAVVTVQGKVNLSDLSWTDLGSPLTFNPTVGATTYNFFQVKIAVP